MHKTKDDPESSKAYWLKVANIIWPTRQSKMKAYKTLCSLNKTESIREPFVMKAKMEALKELLKTS